VPLRRSSPLEASSSKTPKRQVRGVSTGMPISALLRAKNFTPFSIGGSAELEPAIYSRVKSFCFKGEERNE
jgi:hypothetical protein